MRHTLLLLEGHCRHETLHFSDPILGSVCRLLTRLYAKLPGSTLFELNKQRNEKIWQLYIEGEAISDLEDDCESRLLIYFDIALQMIVLHIGEGATIPDLLHGCMCFRRDCGNLYLKSAPPKKPQNDKTQHRFTRNETIC
jgi:hypothetical protein